MLFRSGPTQVAIDVTSGKHLAVAGGIDSLALIDEVPHRISRVEISRLSEETGAPIAIRNPFIALPVTSSTVAIIDLFSAEVTVADSRSPIRQGMKLSAPEISEEHRRPEEPTIIAAATDGHGNIYCATNGFRRASGMPVLLFNQDGLLVKRLRLILPTIPDLINKKTNSQGWLTPTGMAANAKTIVLFDAWSHLAATYPLN